MESLVRNWCPHEHFSKGGEEMKEEIKGYAILSALIFALSTVVGILVARLYPGFVQLLMKGLRELFGSSGHVHISKPLLFLIIFANNAIKSFLAVAFGVVFAIAPIYFVADNGFLLGLLSYAGATRLGLWKTLLLILPHGILEIPAFIIASAYGIWLGVNFYRYIRGRAVNLKECYIYALKSYVKYVLPLLLVAAFIEAFITPVLFMKFA